MYMCGEFNDGRAECLKADWLKSDGQKAECPRLNV